MEQEQEPIIGISQKYRLYLAECGWNEADIRRIAQDVQATKNQMQAKKDHPPREVTCSTYETAQRRLYKEVDAWMAGKARC